MSTRLPLPAPLVVTLGPALALLLLTALLPGCGRSAEAGGQPAAEAPTSLQDERQKAAPATLEQAEADFEQARLALAQASGLPTPPPPAAAAAPAPSLGPLSEKKRGSTTADEGESHPSVQAAPQRAESTSKEAADQDSSQKNDENPCVTTCKAFASLVRAKEAVCRLDVPNGTRCARAEGIVRDVTPRVQSCQCSS